MKVFICLVLSLGCLAFALGKEEEETTEFVNDIKNIGQVIYKESDADKMAKETTDFVKKYGKTRICKYLAKDLQNETTTVNNPTKQILDSCKDDKHGDKEFTQIVLDAVNPGKEKESNEFRDDLRGVQAAITDNKDAVKTLTDFVNKYGKTRICKYYKAQSNDNEAVQKSCNDEKQGDKEFIEVVKDIYIKPSTASS